MGACKSAVYCLHVCDFRDVFGWKLAHISDPNWSILAAVSVQVPIRYVQMFPQMFVCRPLLHLTVQIIVAC